MENLLGLAQGYLGAEGWDVKARGRDLLRGDRDSSRGDDEKDYVYVWAPADVGGDFSSREGPYLRRFEEAKEEHPTAEKVFLVPTLEGLSTEFRSGARRWHGVKTLVPAQFFDSDFKWERDGRAASATSELRRRGADRARTRIAQPFHIAQSPDPNSERDGTDLLDVLRAELRSRSDADDRPTIHIVVGPAGMGKSVLFESLYARLYDDFQSDKRSFQLSARPFALLPEHLYDASAPTIGSLLDAYLRTEFARPMDRDMFNWKLVHGMGVWLLDGLDEILERDAQFFDHLEDLMTMPFGEAPPSVLISVRDSLFSTHRGLNDFCNEFSGNVIVYQLSGWQRSSKRELARRELGSSEAAATFTDRLDASPALDELASTPYYCKLLTDEFETGAFDDSFLEQDMMERGIQRIIARERGKEFLGGIPDREVRDFIESCAVMNLFDGGVSTEEVRELAEVVVRPDVGAKVEIERLVTQLGQIAVFAQGYDGRLRFAQEPLEHYLAASYLARGVQSGLEVLGRHELPENVVRLMCGAIATSDATDDVWGSLVEKLREDSVAGRNALRIAIQLSAGTDRLNAVQLAGLDLSGIRFSGHTLRSMSFDGADLTNTDFRSAEVTLASFDSCLIKGTRFAVGTAMLESIRFGEMHRFYSAHVGDRFFDDFALLRDFIAPAVASPDDDQPACAAARQLRHFFGKFVEETGRGRRKDLPERALLRGTQTVQNREGLLREAIRAGYLVEVPNRGRISRAQDDSYSEIVKFRTDLEMSPGIRAVLDETCEDADCTHVR